MIENTLDSTRNTEDYALVFDFLNGKCFQFSMSILYIVLKNSLKSLYSDKDFS